jgi:predicted AAA+ superfamily ATPase
MIERDLTTKLRAVARAFPAVTVTGPRQSGKSTLCRAVFPHHAYANLEPLDVRLFAQEDPRAFLAQFPHGAILDEVQRCPQLPSFLQVLIDQDPAPGKWILTGSHNLNLLESVSQSLAGRTAVLHLLPLSHGEILRFHQPSLTLDETLFTGGYPRIFDRKLDPSDWLGAYVATYLERDVRNILKIGDLATFQRFVELCAGRTAQLLNLSALGGDCGISQPTAKAWISVLEASFILFRLPAFSRNPAKRLVKMPKLHFYDTGLVCWLLGIRTPEQLRNHPLRGSIFETWVASEIIKSRIHHNVTGGLFHYRDRHGCEVDLICSAGESLVTVEAKSGATVAEDMLASLRKVHAEIHSPGTSHPWLVYGGDIRQKRSDVTVLPWHTIHGNRWY